VKLYRRAGLVVALLIACASSEQTQKAATPDRNAFTFTEWNLSLRLETKLESISVRGRVTLRNDSSRPQQHVAMQLSSSLNWASIREDGKLLQFAASQLDSDLDHSGKVEEAVVTLSSPVQPGESMELQVGYSGTVSLDTTRLANLGVPLEVRTATEYDRITPTFTCLRGVGHVLWFPVSLEPASMGEGNRVFEEASAWQVRHALSTMTVTVSSDLPQPLRSNAQFSLYESMGQNRSQEYQWRHLGFVGPVLAGGDYRTLAARQEKSAPPFSIDYFLDHQLQAADYARVIRDTLPTITGKASLPASVIELPEDEDTTFDADSVLLTPLKPIDRKSLELTIAYMLAHQTLWSPRAWIYEGAAHLAQVLMRERQDGRAAAIAFMEQRLAPLALADSGAPETAYSNSLVNTTSEVFYRTKAMYVWWMLRELVGERALTDTLQQYDSSSDKQTSYMQKLLEKNSHKDLEWFFDDWVYQDRGLPQLSISNGYARPSLQGIYLVSATIENTGSAAAEVPVFVHTAGGDVVSRIRVSAHNKTAIRLEVGSRPTEVSVNDGSVPEADKSNHTAAVKIGNQ
jgi:hypothetical protein